MVARVLVSPERIEYKAVENAELVGEWFWRMVWRRRLCRRSGKGCRWVMGGSSSTGILRDGIRRFKLAIARDDSVHHVLPIPLSVE